MDVHRLRLALARTDNVDKGFDYFYGIPASMNYGILTYIENRRILDPPTLWTARVTSR